MSNKHGGDIKSVGESLAQLKTHYSKLIDYSINSGVSALTLKLFSCYR